MLPIPPSEYHYADPSLNDEAQTAKITPFVNHLQYPTLGAPALLTAERTLDALVSLPKDEDAATLTLTLVDRHGNTGEHPLTLTGTPEALGLGPEGKTGQRQLWHIRASLTGHAPKLYDLKLRTATTEETQLNAVRVYNEITGDEKVIFSGDPQYYVKNGRCLARFVDLVNARDDIAWVALIGDVCDNHVDGSLNVFRLALKAKPGPVSPYYEEEFPGAHKELSRLNKPIVLVPGNHDGMVAYKNYEPGTKTDVYLGPDPKNEVAYDGLHHFRRTFGPLFHRFDWHNTVYLATNTFELDRHQRLGFHGIVTNWGGWMRPPQVRWLADELSTATQQNKHKVALMHHDPRGGALSRDLGYYKEYREFDYDSTRDIVFSYARYVVSYARTWQQEWMRWPQEPLAQHPVRKLLSLFLDHKLWAVVMGHDNECWVDSYFEGQGIFTAEPKLTEYAAGDEQDVPDDIARKTEDGLREGDMEALVSLLSTRPDDEADAAVRKALDRIGDDPALIGEPDTYAPDEVNAWGLRAQRAIHFVHVDDIGAYEYTKDKHLKEYGYVVAQLREGRPVTLERFDLLKNQPNDVATLAEE